MFKPVHLQYQRKTQC